MLEERLGRMQLPSKSNYGNLNMGGDQEDNHTRNTLPNGQDTTNLMIERVVLVYYHVVLSGFCGSSVSSD